jgi:hypothetical protein
MSKIHGKSGETRVFVDEFDEEATKYGIKHGVQWIGFKEKC